MMNNVEGKREGFTGAKPMPFEGVLLAHGLDEKVVGYGNVPLMDYLKVISSNSEGKKIIIDT